MEENLNIFALNGIDRKILKFLQKNLSGIFNTKTRILKSIIIPLSYYNPVKKQYDGHKIFKYFIDNLTLGNAKDINIAIFNRDIFISHLNFIFGLGTAFPKACLVSIIRLHPHFNLEYFRRQLERRKHGKFPLFIKKLDRAESALFHERILKEVIHEIGHALGLHHCNNRRCVMSFSNSLVDTDYKSTEFCPDCIKSL